MTAPAVVLCTDFGLADPYVGEMKGALYAQWCRYPGVSERPAVIDLCHDVPAGDVAAGAFVLARGAGHFPPGTVFVAVIDPGVGTGRLALAVGAAGKIYVAPGNGLLAHLASEPDLVVRVFDRPPSADAGEPSATFHGRDLFAPTAAHLAAGLPLEAVGAPGTVSDLGVLPELVLDDGALGRVVWIDRFGNAVTDVAPESAGGRALILDGLVVDGPRRTYGDAPAEAPFWYVGSGGTVEFALRGGHGARTFSWHVGMAVRLSAP